MRSMLRVGISASGLIVATVVACGNTTEHPPPAEVTGGSSGASGGLVDGGPRGEGGLGEGGVGEGGVPSPLGTMDPKEMYLLGSLTEGAGQEVLTSLADANSFSAGFNGSAARYGFIHPTDGFVYRGDDKSVHRFVADPSPKLEITGTSRRWVDYPTNTDANDAILPMLPCTNDVGRVLYAPDTGKYFHTCGTSANDLRDETGTVVATCTSGFIAVGYNKTILCRDTVYDSAGVSHPLDPTIPTGVAHRGKADGTFHLVAATGSGTGTTFALWNIAPTTGAGVKVYDYAKLTGFSPINADVRGWIELDAQARLYRWGGSTTTGSTIDVVARFDDKGGELVYNEANVFVKMHGSNMITGY